MYREVRAATAQPIDNADKEADGTMTYLLFKFQQLQEETKDETWSAIEL